MTRRQGRSRHRTVDHALIWAYDGQDDLPIADVALDKHTLAGRRRGRGWEHFFDEGNLLADPETGDWKLSDDRYGERAREAVQRPNEAERGDASQGSLL
jgi:hypothetical protein